MGLFSPPHRLLVLVAGFFIFGLTYFARVDVTSSDPALTLLVSQSIIEAGTIKLDAYKETVGPHYHFDLDYRLEEKNGHYYHFYPLGTPIFSIPFVAVANLFGQNMAIPEHEGAVQNVVSATLCVAVFFLLYLLGRCYLNYPASFLIAFFSMLGSSLISTMGVALWSINFTTFFNTLVLYHLARYERHNIERINSYWLAFLLFAAYLSRPTAALFVAVVAVYLFFQARREFFKLAVVTIILFTVFAGFNWREYGELLPTYYAPSTHLTNRSWLVGLYGNLFSPARGLLIFSPFLIFVFGGTIWFFHKLKKYPLFWLSLIWFSLHILATSVNSMWWGGHSYGSRLLTEVMPALVLVTVLLWREISQERSRQTKTILAAGYLVLGLAGLFINTYQGLYNPYTNQWNKSPNIDTNPHYLFDWTYPQFLATGQSLQARSVEHQQAQLGLYSPGDLLTYDSDKALFEGWAEPEIGWRWSESPTPQILFKLGTGVLTPDQPYLLEILGASIRDQQVGVWLNGTQIGNLRLEAFAGDVPASQTLTFQANLLHENGLNRVEFHLPDDGPEVPDEIPHLGQMAFVSLKLYPFRENEPGIHYFDGQFFETGFSGPERAWRWTDSQKATLIYPMGRVKAGREYILALTSGAAGVQEVEILVNNRSIGHLTFETVEPQSLHLAFSGSLLKPNEKNRIQFRIPNATVPEGDTRRLGLAFVSLEIYPAP